MRTVNSEATEVKGNSLVRSWSSVIEREKQNAFMCQATLSAARGTVPVM